MTKESDVDTERLKLDVGGRPRLSDQCADTCSID
jgi:hypothetical protein